MARIKDLTAATPGKDDVIVVDGAGGTHKVSLGALAGIIGRKGVAGFHNSVFRGVNLKERWGISDDKALADEVSRRIADGSFDDLFVGDWWPATITTEFGTEEVINVLAGFDVYLNSICEYDPVNDDYNPITRHHAVVVTRKEFKTKHRMHPTTPIPTSGYTACEINTTTLPKYAAALNEALNGHIIEICDTYSYDIDGTLTSANQPDLLGVTTSWDWSTDFRTHLTLLTERELYGAPAYSCGACEVGFETSQLPLFRLDPSAKITGYWYWLKDVASSHCFCNCYGYGRADYGNAANAYGVRPRFLIG